MDILDLVNAIEAGRVRTTDHAEEEAEADGLDMIDVWHSVKTGRVIEDYPSDYPFPSCLVFGMTRNGEPVHSVCAYNEKTRWAVLVTVYRPDPGRWTEGIYRRNRS